MSIIEKLATSLNRRDEIPNQELAREILKTNDKKAIKEPTKGKKVTPDEFAKERNKMMEEMQNNGGGSFRIRLD